MNQQLKIKNLQLNAFEFLLFLMANKKKLDCGYGPRTSAIYGLSEPMTWHFPTCNQSEILNTYAFTVKIINLLGARGRGGENMPHCKQIKIWQYFK